MSIFPIYPPIDSLAGALVMQTSYFKEIAELI